MKNFIQLHVHIQTWKNDILQNCDKKALLVLIGNKIDLKEERIVSYKEGNQFAKDNGMLFFEVSCKEGVNIEKIFNESAKLITDGIHIGKYDVDNSNSGINSYNNKNKNQMKIENINHNTTNCCLTGKVDFHFHLHVT